MVSLFAVSDLHVTYPENRALVEQLRPETSEDWLVVAGDVGERLADIESVLTTLAARFRIVIWAPGNHELWTHPRDPCPLRGLARYEQLVQICRGLGVLTPEDEFAVWTGEAGPVVIAPLFVLYDYSFRRAGVSRDEALAEAYQRGVVCTDEMFLHPDPYPTREAWCEARITLTEKRLQACDPKLSTVLVSHWPLVRQPTEVLHFPQFAQWCGTQRTADWHVRFRASAAVYGHLHIPRTTYYDGVRFEEVSLGYPREWRPRDDGRWPLRAVFSSAPGQQ